MEGYPHCYSRGYKSPVKPIEAIEEDFKGGFGEEAREKSLSNTLVLSQNSDLRTLQLDSGSSIGSKNVMKTRGSNRSSLSCWSCFTD
jgi:hypothetical protein